jgi:inner membrane protein
LASVISHPIPAVLANMACKNISRKQSLLSYSILLTIMPDFDVLAFALGIPYEHMLGHRGFTHSIIFAVLVSLFIAKYLLKYQGIEFKKGFFILFFSCISHGIFDAFTNGGYGVGFFIPFTADRYFFPITPIEVSPIGIRNFFSYRGLQVFVSELKVIWFPSSIIYLSLLLFKKVKKKRLD